MTQSGGHTSQGSGGIQPLPDKDADINWPRSEDAIKAALSALVDGYDIMEQEAPARPIGDNPFDVAVGQRERWKYNLKVSKDFQGAEKKGTSMLLSVTVNNASASHVLKNFVTESRTVQANANAAARILDPAHVDLPWRVPRCRDQLAALAAHFYPKNELLGSVRMAEARQVQVLRYEPVASFVVRLQTCINRVDEVRPHRLILYEMRELLDAGLAESKEPPLVNLATRLQMAPQATT
jgi:hypothetical protein